jgi:hypothetical protein
MKTTDPASAGVCGICPQFFDIVNGFLIDAATRPASGFQGPGETSVANLAEIIVRT